MKAILWFFSTLLVGTSSLSVPSLRYDANPSGSTILIKGTSTLHDWEVNVASFAGSIEASLLQDSIHLKELKLTVPVTQLKSGKKAMDKNMYRVLDSETHPSIEYRLTHLLNSKVTGIKKYQLLTRGKLNVAGETRVLRLPIRIQQKMDGLECTGSTTLLMSRFGVEAPSFFFGSVSTGDSITIHFTINFN